MSSAKEAAAAKTPLASDLAAGVETISLTQRVEFTLYAKIVLPLDSWVFWIRADLLSAVTLANIVAAAQLSSADMPLPKIKALGSLHYAIDVRQEEAETLAVNAVTFTSLEEVQDLNKVGPTLLYVAEFEGQRFAFSNRKNFYRQASLFHYFGNAVYPDMENQLVDDVSDFDDSSVVVSNSLPAWLALNGYDPPYGFGNPGITLYPSFLVPPNIVPPFAAVHIFPESTRPLALAPRIGSRSSHYQLCAERVKITLWGTRNDEAMDFVDCVNQYSTDVGIFGLMSASPAPQDEKRTQAELGTIAMKKSLTWEISYHQSRIRDVAQKIIKTAIPTYYINGQADEAA
jgi:hypothetical protein